jgi:hypothetical protein
MRSRRRQRIGYAWLMIALCTATLLAPPTPALASETVTYAYDELGRLVKVAHSGAVNNGLSACYAYDKADNRQNVAVATASDCGSPAPSFSINSASAIEGTAVAFTVTKTGTASGTLTVQYASAGGTATSGTDFTATSGTLTFLAADATKTISVPTTVDAVADSAETFTVTLSNPSSGSIIGTATGTGTINDNVGPLTCSGVSFAAADITISEGDPLLFTIHRSGSTTPSCSVDYATQNGTAITPNDYAAGSGTLTFASGVTNMTVSFTTNTAGPNESTEYMSLNLSNPSSGATVSDAQALGTILNYNDTCLTCLQSPQLPPDGSTSTPPPSGQSE